MSNDEKIYRSKMFAPPLQRYNRQKIADMHYLYGLCNGDAKKAEAEYKKMYPRRITPNFYLFTEVHRRFRKYGVPQNGEPRFNKMQIADMHFIYGFCNGDAKAAVDEYKRRYPTQTTPSQEDFTKVRERVCKLGKKDAEELYLEMTEKDKAKMRAFFKKSYKSPSFRKVMLGFGMHPVLMSEIFKKGEPNLPLVRSLVNFKKQGIRISFTESDCENYDVTDAESDNESIEFDSDEDYDSDDE